MPLYVSVELPPGHMYLRNLTSLTSYVDRGVRLIFCLNEKQDQLELYSAANDPRPDMIPRPEMIPKLDRK